MDMKKEKLSLVYNNYCNNNGICKEVQEKYETRIKSSFSYQVYLFKIEVANFKNMMNKWESMKRQVHDNIKRA
jgi:hypothetical protein